MDAGTDADRRRHDRAAVDGCALIRASGHALGAAAHCRIVNLSLGGLLVRDVDAGARFEIGMPVTIELELDRDHVACWATQAGEVVRASGAEIAIGFAALEPATASMIASEIRSAQDAEEMPHVVVVDPSPGRRRRITERLRAAGARSYEAATPLEAVDHLERSRVHVRGVAVARRTRSQTDSDELVDYLSSSHPDLRLALIEEDDENLGSEAVRELLAPRTSSP